AKNRGNGLPDRNMPQGLLPFANDVGLLQEIDGLIHLKQQLGQPRGGLLVDIDTGGRQTATNTNDHAGGELQKKNSVGLPNVSVAADVDEAGDDLHQLDGVGGSGGEISDPLDEHVDGGGQFGGQRIFEQGANFRDGGGAIGLMDKIVGRGFLNGV